MSALCDRRRGLGADGVLRVTTAGAALAAGRVRPGARGRARRATGTWTTATPTDRSRRCAATACGCSRTTCGPAAWRPATSSSSDHWPVRGRSSCTTSTPPTPTSASTWARPTSSGPGEAIVGGRQFAGLAVDVGNPHLACVDPGADRRGAGGAGRRRAGELRPHAVPGRRQRRGADRPGRRRGDACGYTNGEWAKPDRAEPEPSPRPSRRCRTPARPRGTLTVRVPGGEVTVTVTEATSYLRGPSVLVARGELSEEWWQEQSALNRMHVARFGVHHL